MTFKVMDRACNQCLFTAPVVSTRRRAGILRDCAERQSFFVCHKASGLGEEVCCHEFYERLGHRSQMVRIMERLNAVERVSTDEYERRFAEEYAP